MVLGWLVWLPLFSLQGYFFMHFLVLGYLFLLALAFGMLRKGRKNDG